jgi:hypothetical protein
MVCVAIDSLRYLNYADLTIDHFIRGLNLHFEEYFSYFRIKVFLQYQHPEPYHSTDLFYYHTN